MENQLNTKLTFVSCIYDDLFGTEFGGRPHPYYRYYQGIESAIKLNAPFVIFTWDKDVEKVRSHFINYLGHEEFDKRMRVIAYDLHNTPIRETVKTQLSKNSWVPSDRCIDVMFGKFFMVKKSIQENYYNSDYFFWIDAGLSNSCLFPYRHMDQTRPDKREGWCNLFTETVTKKLIQFSENKILLIKMSQVGQYVNRDHLSQNWDGGYIIGGLFGGKKDNINNFSDQVLDLFRHFTDNSQLYFEEPIMTILYSRDQENFHTLNFDVWAHEDSGQWVQDSIKNQISFYRTFEELNLVDNGLSQLQNKIFELEKELTLLHNKKNNILTEIQKIDHEISEKLSEKAKVEENIILYDDIEKFKKLFMIVSPNLISELLNERENKKI